MLLTSGYLADAGVFYCPSSLGMRSDDCDSAGKQKGRWLLEHWKTAGGLDGNTLMYGNWQPTWWGTAAIAENKVSVSRYAQMVTGSYHYRDVLINIEAGDPPLPNTKAPPAIKPKVYAKVGQPLFRSLRQLGPRAVVCDTFSKGSTFDALGKNVGSFQGSAISNSQQIAGMGLLAHREGYNVLFGGGNVVWYGDPQQKFIWRAQGYNQLTRVGASTDYNMMSSNGYLDGPASGAWDQATTYAQYANTVFAAWTELDNWAGIDTP